MFLLRLLLYIIPLELAGNVMINTLLLCYVQSPIYRGRACGMIVNHLGCFFTTSIVLRQSTVIMVKLDSTQCRSEK